jgi:hypothetical protein
MQKPTVLPHPLDVNVPRETSHFPSLTDDFEDQHVPIKPNSSGDSDSKPDTKILPNGDRLSAWRANLTKAINENPGNIIITFKENDIIVE